MLNSASDSSKAEPHDLDSLVEKTKTKIPIQKRVSFGILAFFLLLLWIVRTPNALCEYFANQALEARNPNATLNWVYFEEEWLGLTDRLLVLETRANLQQGENAAASQSIQKLRTRKPKSIDADVLESLVALQLGDKSQLQRLLENKTGNVPLTELFEASARCHLFHMDQDSMLATLDHWTAFNSKDPAIAYYRGRWEEASDRPEAAIVHYQEASVPNSSFTKPRFRKGILLRELRQFTEAAAEFEPLVGTETGAISATERAYCLLLLGDAESAWNQMEKVLGLPSSSQLQAYQRVDQFAEGDRFALIGGSILESLSRYEEAKNLLQQALEANVRNSEARVLLISCFNRLQLKEEAERESKIQAEMTRGKLECKNLADQLAVDSSRFEDRLRYATLLFRYKSLGESQLEAENLCKAFPEEPEIYRLLGAIYRERTRESSDWDQLAVKYENIAQKLDSP